MLDQHPQPTPRQPSTVEVEEIDLLPAKVGF
jgi:hypothetical protein